MLHYASINSSFLSSIPPFPFKDAMGEESAAYMHMKMDVALAAHVYYLKVGLWDQLLNAVLH